MEASFGSCGCCWEEGKEREGRRRELMLMVGSEKENKDFRKKTRKGEVKEGAK